MDISNGFDSIIELILQGFQFAYNTLDSITFHGISLLDFMLWILCLGIILPIVLTLLSSGRSSAESYYNQQSREAEARARAEARKKGK